MPPARHVGEVWFKLNDACTTSSNVELRPMAHISQMIGYAESLQRGGQIIQGLLLLSLDALVSKYDGHIKRRRC